MNALAIYIVFLLSWININTGDINSRFKAPAGYVTLATTNFGKWLGGLPLKAPGTHTVTYNGSIARTDAYTAAVIDMSVGSQDLQQCADAVMRLRAEYLYHQKRYTDIAFNFTNGFRCDYVHYADGYRCKDDNKWVKKAAKDTSYATFIRYMNLVFSYAGTLSLEKELVKVSNAKDLRAGMYLFTAALLVIALLCWVRLRTRRTKRNFYWRRVLCPHKIYRYCSKTMIPGLVSANLRIYLMAI